MFMADIVLSCSGFLDPRPLASSSSSSSVQRLFLRSPVATLPLPPRRLRPPNPHATDSSSSPAPAPLELVSTTVCSDGSVIYRFGAAADVGEAVAADGMKDEAVEAMRWASDGGSLVGGDLSGRPEPAGSLERLRTTEEERLVASTCETQLEVEEGVDRKAVSSLLAGEEVGSGDMQSMEHIRIMGGDSESSISLGEGNGNVDVKVVDCSGKLQEGIDTLGKVGKLQPVVEGECEKDGTEGGYEWNMLDQQKKSNLVLGKLEVEERAEAAGVVEESADDHLQDGESFDVKEVNLEEGAESSYGSEMIGARDGEILQEERSLAFQKEGLERLLLRNEGQEEEMISVGLPQVQQDQEVSYLSIEKVYLAEDQDGDLEETIISKNDQEALQDERISNLNIEKLKDSDLQEITMNPVTDEGAEHTDKLLVRRSFEKKLHLKVVPVKGRARSLHSHLLSSLQSEEYGCVESRPPHPLELPLLVAPLALAVDFFCCNYLLRAAAGSPCRHPVVGLRRPSSTGCLRPPSRHPPIYTPVAGSSIHRPPASLLWCCRPPLSLSPPSDNHGMQSREISGEYRSRPLPEKREGRDESGIIYVNLCDPHFYVILISRDLFEISSRSLLFDPPETKPRSDMANLADNLSLLFPLPGSSPSHWRERERERIRRRRRRSERQGCPPSEPPPVSAIAIAGADAVSVAEVVVCRRQLCHPPWPCCRLLPLFCSPCTRVRRKEVERGRGRATNRV
ncbi:hypothetical protein Taro_032955 [Colocasia esculenta]|uniref:Uncharacterized protein n=1 Tax=Colocasia esculenta TaxID=4460 RepID=A0A843WB04_COLES|nr:hypothetical protein [Colocasia esculenta]